MNAKSRNLIAYVFCYDDRATSWLNVLSKQFFAIRLIKGEYTTQNYSGKINGELKSIGDRAFQEILDENQSSILVAFVHTGRSDPDNFILESKKINFNFVFKFNADVSPVVAFSETSTYPIRRNTANTFEINDNDVSEIIDFITGRKIEIPRCCTYFKTSIILPSLSILCQGYLAVHEGNPIYLEVKKLNLIDNIKQKQQITKKSEWWQYPFNGKTQASLTNELKKELQVEKLPSEISDLINAIYDESITEDKVQKAYGFIVKRLIEV